MIQFSLKRNLTFGLKCGGPVRWDQDWIGYLRPDQFLDHLTVIQIAQTRLQRLPAFPAKDSARSRVATLLHYEQCKDSALLSIYDTVQDRTKQFDNVLQCKTASGTDENISAGLTQTIANYSIKGRRRAEEEARRTNMVGHAEKNCLCIKHFKNTQLL